MATEAEIRTNARLLIEAKDRGEITEAKLKPMLLRAREMIEQGEFDQPEVAPVQAQATQPEPTPTPTPVPEAAPQIAPAPEQPTDESLTPLENLQQAFGKTMAMRAISDPIALGQLGGKFVLDKALKPETRKTLSAAMERLGQTSSPFTEPEDAVDELESFLSKTTPQFLLFSALEKLGTLEGDDASRNAAAFNRQLLASIRAGVARQALPGARSEEFLTPETQAQFPEQAEELAGTTLADIPEGAGPIRQFLGQAPGAGLVPTSGAELEQFAGGTIPFAAVPAVGGTLRTQALKSVSSATLKNFLNKPVIAASSVGAIGAAVENLALERLGNVIDRPINPDVSELERTANEALSFLAGGVAGGVLGAAGGIAIQGGRRLKTGLLKQFAKNDLPPALSGKATEQNITQSISEAETLSRRPEQPDATFPKVSEAEIDATGSPVTAVPAEGPPIAKTPEDVDVLNTVVDGDATIKRLGRNLKDTILRSDITRVIQKAIDIEAIERSGGKSGKYIAGLKRRAEMILHTGEEASLLPTLREMQVQTRDLTKVAKKTKDLSTIKAHAQDTFKNFQAEAIRVKQLFVDDLSKEGTAGAQQLIEFENIKDIDLKGFDFDIKPPPLDEITTQDPSTAINKWIRDVKTKLSDIEVMGPKRQGGQRNLLIERALVEADNELPDQASKAFLRELVDFGLGFKQEKVGVGGKALRELRQLQVITKLRLAAVSNLADISKLFIRTGRIDTPLIAIRNLMFDKAARANAARSGAMVFDLGAAGKDLDLSRKSATRFLKHTGTVPIETGIRVLNAATTQTYAEQMLKRLRKAKARGVDITSDKQSWRTAMARRRLGQLVDNVDEVVNRKGGFTETELQQIGYRGVADSQPISALDAPHYASFELGKAALQFRSFAIKHMFFVSKFVVREAKKGNPFPSIMLAATATAFGMPVFTLKNWLRGKATKKEATTFVDGLTSIGGLGLFTDFGAAIKSGRPERMLGTLVGPVFQDMAQWALALNPFQQKLLGSGFKPTLLRKTTEVAIGKKAPFLAPALPRVFKAIEERTKKRKKRRRR